MMSSLIKLGADPMFANSSGRTPMQLLALKVTPTPLTVSATLLSTLSSVSAFLQNIQELLKKEVLCKHME